MDGLTVDRAVQGSNHGPRPTDSGAPADRLEAGLIPRFRSAIRRVTTIHPRQVGNVDGIAA